MNARAALLRSLRKHVTDPRVLEAIASVPRERFVPAGQRSRAYDNVALPIACEQTISQPLVVARMLELLELTPTDRVLDVGTGSGYHAAVLARLCAHVWTIEIHPELSAEADRALRTLGIDNVTVVVGDGRAGLPDCAPFDAINVAAAAAGAVPAALEQQLALGGRLVAPVEDPVEDGGQHLVVERRTAAGVLREWADPVRFVPLVG